jgi:hypothetical protein
MRSRAKNLMQSQAKKPKVVKLEVDFRVQFMTIRISMFELSTYISYFKYMQYLYKLYNIFNNYVEFFVPF